MNPKNHDQIPSRQKFSLEEFNQLIMDYNLIASRVGGFDSFKIGNGDILSTRERKTSGMDEKNGNISLAYYNILDFVMEFLISGSKNPNLRREINLAFKSFTKSNSKKDIDVGFILQLYFDTEKRENWKRKFIFNNSEDRPFIDILNMNRNNLVLRNLLEQITSTITSNSPTLHDAVDLILEGKCDSILNRIITTSENGYRCPPVMVKAAELRLTELPNRRSNNWES